MTVCRHSPRTHFGTPVYVGGIHIDNITPINSISVGSNGSVCEGTAPSIRYNEISSIWEFSNNGASWLPLGSGSTIISGSAFTAVKATEYIISQIDKDTNHTLPNSETFKSEQGAWLDVIFNGQLLTHTLDGRDFDYEEVSTSQVKFHFDVKVNSILTYIVRKRP